MRPKTKKGALMWKKVSKRAFFAENSGKGAFYVVKLCPLGAKLPHKMCPLGVKLPHKMCPFTEKLMCKKCPFQMAPLVRIH